MSVVILGSCYGPVTSHPSPIRSNRVFGSPFIRTRAQETWTKVETRFRV